MEVWENLLIGVVSGIVSSFIVTQIYRQIDKKQNRLEYINELLQFAGSFVSVTIHTGRVEIEDEYVEKVYNFVIDNHLPLKKKWVKLKADERKICNDFINFYHKVTNETMIAHLNIRKVDSGEDKYTQEVTNAKLWLSGPYHLEAMRHWDLLINLRKSYTR